MGRLRRLGRILRLVQLDSFRQEVCTIGESSSRAVTRAKTPCPRSLPSLASAASGLERSRVSAYWSAPGNAAEWGHFRRVVLPMLMRTPSFSNSLEERVGALVTDGLALSSVIAPFGSRPLDATPLRHDEHIRGIELLPGGATGC